MSKIMVANALLGLVLAVGVPGAGQAQTEPGGELALRQAVLQALWPADMVQLTNQYLQVYPRGPGAELARSWQKRAADSMRVLNRKDVQLYRSAFQGPGEAAPLNDEIREAALGNPVAALRVAHQYKRGDGVAVDEKRYVGWLQFASVLGSDAASYELALYFREQDQPALAAQYEARAVSLGYNPPLALDHIRK